MKPSFPCLPGCFLLTCFLLMTSLLQAQPASSHLQTTNDSRYLLLSGNNWKLMPVSGISQDGNTLSNPLFDDSQWHEALVPGTSFTSYIPHDGKPGVELNPDYADNIYNVDYTKYDQDFWYRKEFSIPGSFANKRVWINFEGINKQGDVYVNGKKMGIVDGLAQRASFSFLPLTGKNVVAVLVRIPYYVPDKHNLANLESPTYVCSQGWDWMPRVPGLNSGITDDVYLSCSGDVTIHDPWIRTDALTKDKAVLSVSTTLHNGAGKAVSGTLSGLIMPGNIRFSQNLQLSAGADSEVIFSPAHFAQLTLLKPRVWWPNGYGGNPDGTQPLYSCTFSFIAGKQLSDVSSKTFGIRKYSYDTIGGPLHININGLPVFLKGGNWGMSDYLLRCRGDEYDTKLRFHKEMNFNMIRNWTGETTDEEFYDACDKYGIMVWDDFWLNNLGPIDSIDLFERNVIEKVKRYRNHPSIALWCGANEGLPGGSSRSTLNRLMADAIAQYDGNDRRYQPRSNAGTSNEWLTGDSHNLSGSGIWTHEEPKIYFTDPHNGYPWSKHSWSLRSELGAAAFPNVESFKKFIPEEKLWPRNDLWDKHFFSNDGAYGGGSSPTKYMDDIAKRYGASDGIEDFCRKAQLMNLETYKAMFEGWQENMWNDASGLLIWMSQSSYPSMIWQTYDFYYDLTGAYFGSKQACEPVHIQWNPANDSVTVVNNSIHSLSNLSVATALFNTSGKMIPGSGTTTKLSSLGNISKTSVMKLILANEAAPNSVYFIRLQLKDDKGNILSENTYWNGTRYLDFTALNNLPSCLPYLSVSEVRKTTLPNGNVKITGTVSNAATSPVAAFGIRVQPMNTEGTEQVLPAVISDSYFTLMAGESKDITVEFSPTIAKTTDCIFKLLPYNAGNASINFITSKSLQLPQRQAGHNEFASSH